MASPEFAERADRRTSAAREVRDLQHALSSLREADDITPDEREEIFATLIEDLKRNFGAAGGIYCEGTEELYRTFSNETNLIIRREDPSRVLLAIEERDDLPVSFQRQERTPYANAAIWPHGFKIALLQGHGQVGGLGAIVGFRPGRDIRVMRVPPRETDPRSTEFARTARGIVHPEEIRFVTISVPVKLFPQELLSEREAETLFDREGNPRDAHVLRTFIFPQGVRESAHA